MSSVGFGLNRTRSITPPRGMKNHNRKPQGPNLAKSSKSKAKSATTAMVLDPGAKLFIGFSVLIGSFYTI
jgi:hypothetical protein